MPYCEKLKLLLWKNYLLKKRNKFRTLAELFWPIFMFTVLFFLRKIADRQIYHDCYFKSKAMPSVGDLAFMQSFFCAANNTCDPTTKNASWSIYSSSFLSSLMSVTEDLLGVYPNGRPPDTDTRRNLRDVNDEDSQDWSILPDNLRERMAKGDFENIISRYRAANSTRSFPDMRGFSFMDFFFCGYDVPSFQSQLTSMSDDRPGFIGENPNYEMTYPEYENDTTEFCNQLMQDLESDFGTRVVFRMYKPFLRGKLIFTPRAPIIREVMNEIQEKLNGINAVNELYNASTEDCPTIPFTMQDYIQESMKILDKYADTSQDGRKFSNTIADRTMRLIRLAQIRTNMTGDPGQLFGDLLQCVDFDRLVGADNEQEAVEVAKYWLARDRLWALIVFENIPASATELPKKISYKLRTGIDRFHSTTRIKDRRFSTKVRRNPMNDLKELTGGLVYIQDLVETTIIKKLTGVERPPGIFLKQIPFPCHVKDNFRDSITRTFPMFMIISYIFSFASLVKKIVLEKELHIKETMTVIGVYNSLHWIAWFLDTFIPLSLVTFVVSCLLTYGNILAYSQLLGVWAFMLSFLCATICLAFLFSTFFYQASLSASISGLFYFLIYLPYPPTTMFEEEMNPILKMSLCLVSNIAFGLGCTWIADMEETGRGATFRDWSVSPIEGNPITMTRVVMMLLLDSLIYLLLAVYKENVFPGGETVGLPWNFFMKKSYWLGASSSRKKSITAGKETTGQDETRFEPEPVGFLPGISVTGLTKEFGRRPRKKAVNNLTLNFYENQITSFLGHNGAGKSTSILMMTGLIAPTSGKIEIYGVDANAHPEVLRNDIGFCRQQDILLDELTVYEHLTLFARLKDCPKDKTDGEVREMIKDLNLVDKTHTPSKFLSGGMKRKLCVGIAFIGGSRLIFLDEPTAGVDPYSRRAVWELLLKYKKGRTLILTTHFMDEADLLGDRIAIIASGELICCGSSVFLKHNLGRGYYLTIDSNVRTQKTGRSLKTEGLKEADSEISETAEELQKIVTSIIPTAVFVEEVSAEITFLLPIENDPTTFERLFKALDASKNRINFDSYGISDTTLEEIFLKIAEEADLKQEMLRDKTEKSSYFPFCCNPFSIFAKKKNKSSALEEQSQLTTNNRRNLPETSYRRSSQDIHGMALKFKQFTALILKRRIHYSRNYKALLAQVLVPLVFVSVGLYITGLSPQIEFMPPVAMDVNIYGKSSIFYSIDVPNNEKLKKYEEILLGSLGFSSKCVSTPEKCSMKEIPLKSLIYTKNHSTEPCPCRDGNHICPADAAFYPHQAMTSDGHILYNMTGLNISNWLLKTEMNLTKERFGGLSFGYSSLMGLFTFSNFIDIFRIKCLKPQLPQRDQPGFLPPLPDVDKYIQILLQLIDQDRAKELLAKNDVADNIVVWFNTRGWFASSAYLNAAHNLVLRALLPQTENISEYSISLTAHPLPITERQLADKMDRRSNVSLLRALAIVWALAFVPATNAVYLVEERVNGLKHLQFVAGVSRLIYWLATWIWDLIIFTFIAFMIVFIFYLYDEETFVGEDSVGAFIVVILTYGFVSLSCMYPLCFIFKEASSAFMGIAFSSIFFGILTLVTSFSLELLTHARNPFYLNSIFLIFPQFCMGKSLLNINSQGLMNIVMSDFGVRARINYFAWDITMKYIVTMLVTGVCGFIILLLIEYEVFQGRKKNRKRFWVRSNLLEDEDVKMERERVESGGAKKDGDMLIINNLSKGYQHSDRLAVDHICVGIKPGECFGLLGLNGAGKSTVFKMLTGSLKVTDGDATISNYSIISNRRKALHTLGYCPQTNALDSYLTPQEHLNFFTRIRGVTGSTQTRAVTYNIKRLGLHPYRNRMAKALSGGNKRKLNTAIALVGDPELILLDEPTSGMDSRAKRFLWNCIQGYVREGHCVVLTSHSMEECQALCTQLSIMVNGTMRCFGTTQHLKFKYNEGYSLIVRCIKSTEDALLHVEKNIPGSSLLSVNYMQMKFRLPAEASVGTVFKVMNEAKEKKVIEDYSISQTTLESIFLRFAEAQDPTVESAEKNSKCRSCCMNFASLPKSQQHPDHKTQANPAFSPDHTQEISTNVISVQPKPEMEPSSKSE